MALLIMAQRPGATRSLSPLSKGYLPARPWERQPRQVSRVSEDPRPDPHAPLTAVEREQNPHGVLVSRGSAGPAGCTSVRIDPSGAWRSAVCLAQIKGSIKAAVVNKTIKGTLHTVLPPETVSA